MPDWNHILKAINNSLAEAKRKSEARNRTASFRATHRTAADVYGTNKCLFWNCTRTIRNDHFLCREHFEDLQDGFIDECKGCGLAKEKQYQICLTCANKPSTSPRPGKPTSHQKNTWYKEEYSPAWEKSDKDAISFFVCILKLGDGAFYAGQTRELRPRIMEHKDNQERATKGRTPKLIWFSEVPTKSEATEWEAALKKLVETNPRRIRHMVTDFKDLVNELDWS